MALNVRKIYVDGGANQVNIIDDGYRIYVEWLENGERKRECLMEYKYADVPFEIQKAVIGLLMNNENRPVTF